MSYKIMIDETQRSIIEVALECLTPEQLQYAIGEYEPTASEEHSSLLELFKELPKKEEEIPDALHGFCL